ncbi:unnamed protein product [Meganyctiphanes norvegica]|uniref:Uncharacterized protein n=1 Tax=Meganyctiphanes norvegica TaxID=48144 RepID=A0AAV2QIB5_MEGNR
MVNAMNTTKSKKYAEFYSQFIKTSQLTMEMLKEQDVQCGDSLKKYLEDEDSVYKMNSASVQDKRVLTVNKWKTLSDCYNILEEIAGLKIGSDFQMLGFKQSDVENENKINVHSAASFIRQANLVPSNNIPEIEKLEETMVPCLEKKAICP